MRFVVKDMDIETGGPLIGIINKKDAKFLDLHNGDRVKLNHGKKNAIAIIDIAESKKAVPTGKIGCFEELLTELKEFKLGTGAFGGSTEGIGLIQDLEMEVATKELSFLEGKKKKENKNKIEAKKNKVKKEKDKASSMI